MRKTPRWVPKFIFKERARLAVLVGYFFAMVIPQLVMLSLSDHFLLQGDLTLSTSLYQAGMTYLAASYILFATFFGLFFVVFRKAAVKRIKVMKVDSDANQKKESVMLVLTISRVLCAEPPATNGATQCFLFVPS